jgi:acetylornithine deacetylase/succinyl-diaminopimelate desuccinylase-like protein
VAPCRALAAVSYARAQRARFVGELAHFAGFPSISTEPGYSRDAARCGEWLARHLRSIGLEHVDLVPTPRNPIVTASWLGAPGAPTLLIYGHYDVYGTGPLHAWTAPPFPARVAAGRMFGRGAADDKGQLWIHVKAIESWLRATGRLPVNVRCVFEGEEEIGSTSLLRWLPGVLRRGPVDAAVLSDMPMRGAMRPALTESLRGTLRVEVEIAGAQHDLHSGNFGGAVENPVHALCRLLARLHDPEGRIAIPGFYEGVRTHSAGERAYMARTGPSDAELLAQARAPVGSGEAGFTAYERTTIRPAVNVTAVFAGNTGTGAKAAIPARARAQLDFRLVPDQDPLRVEDLVREHIARMTVPGLRPHMRTLMRARPVQLARSGPLVWAATAACRQVFGRAPVFLRLGGTVPVVQLLARLRIPTLAMGFALSDDKVHAADESFRLTSLYRGIETSIRLLGELARRMSASFDEPLRLPSGGAGISFDESQSGALEPSS